ncbi:MAG: hypothetical protein CMJ83_18315 [Planctomycetes bacterium]|nr:hypothetical protein [Planctomycetota bacterium]
MSEFPTLRVENVPLTFSFSGPSVTTQGSSPVRGRTPDAPLADPSVASTSTGAVGVQEGDSVAVSEAARRLYDAERGAKSDDDAAGKEPAPKLDTGLTEEEQREVEELKARDREVRAHEQAHLSALSGVGGGRASYSYAQGPDGQHYATGGEVPVSISEVPGDPQQTLQHARTIIRAALAPAQPSSADYAAAAQARQLERSAREELAEAKREEIEGTDEQPGVPGDGLGLSTRAPNDVAKAASKPEAPVSLEDSHGGPEHDAATCTACRVAGVV